MTKEKLTRFLQSNGLISPAQAESITQDFVAHTISKNDFLPQAGAVSDDYFFLDSGFVRALVYDTEGNDVSTGFYASGQVVFEVASFFNRALSS